MEENHKHNYSPIIAPQTNTLDDNNVILFCPCGSVIKVKAKILDPNT